MKTVSPNKSAGARARGAIQRGETGDKVPGFDPAAAPMETDAEAGGNSQIAAVKCAPRSTKADDNNASSQASGMREWAPEEEAQPERGTAQMREGHAYLVWWFIIIAVVVIGYFVSSWEWQ
ncbi:hypothetical protein H7Q97_19090 [Ochrobactrum sp. CM-21-5]|nr:hypothetical protein [Ochrobactrum sp. CM-21-5]